MIIYSYQYFIKAFRNIRYLVYARLCCRTTCASFNSPQVTPSPLQGQPPLLSLDLLVQHVLLHEQDTGFPCKVYYICSRLWLSFTSNQKKSQVRSVTLKKSSNKTYRRGIFSDFTVHIIKKNNTYSRLSSRKSKSEPNSEESRLFQREFWSILPWIYTPVRNSRWRTAQKSIST